MNRAELERLGALIFGAAWKMRLAKHLGCNRKTVSRWIAADEVPEWAAVRIRAALFPTPPDGSTPDDDRDLAMEAAIVPFLTDLVDMAEAQGWDRAEVSAAIFSLALSDILNAAGRSAALEHLEAARQAIDRAVQ
jgi:hypothetical protein